MSGFPASWLDLRAPADRAARAPATLAACRDCFAGAEALSVCDLGAGVGATAWALKELLPADRRWRLVDIDAGNLQIAHDRLMAAGERVEVMTADITRDLQPWPDDCGLVTASALFDLASPAWIKRFVESLAQNRTPLLALLTYNGDQRLTPVDPDDQMMLNGFNRHQTLDKGLGGPAAGPGAVAILREALEAAGYQVQQAESPWRLTEAEHGPMIAEILRGWTAACIEADLAPKSGAEKWLERRLAATEGLYVGHVDLFATPI